VSLIVANLAVVLTYIYRLMRNGEDLDPVSVDTATLSTKLTDLNGHKGITDRASFELQAKITHFEPV
jgi:hypothetical protein